MIVYKIDIIAELEKIGLKSTIVKRNGVFGQETMKKFKRNDSARSMKTLNKLCCVLGLQPNDILEYIESQDDRYQVIEKINELRW
ncbi:helix-turn-helix domain-containing protein [Anaerostipes caccae]|uniref:helix-turn-helix domain-containing protein n=1 Tax=Anaerostipes caccae TaxID=105841 RepID=UPI00101C4A4C|nr:helix-turn-helix transcriptional regulator [Anaerostipes caccae]